MSLWRNGKNRKSFKKSDISKPTQFEHRIHADFDPITGNIRGLPLQWQAFIPSNFMHNRSKFQPIYDSSCLTSNHYQKTNFNRNDYETLIENGLQKYFQPSDFLLENSVYAKRNFSRQEPLKNYFIHSSSLPINLPHKQLKFSNNFTDNEFRLALLNAVNPNDPRSDLSKFIKLECGSTSTVFVSYCHSHRRNVVVKCINIWRHKRRDLLFNEILLVKGLKHPNLVEVLSSHLVNDELWVIMEFMEKGSLTNVITHKRIEEALIATISRQCLEGLAFLHSHNIIHRDIKSDAILIDANGNIKISDFGFCGQLTPECPKRRSLLGTPYWFSAQVASQEPYGTDADIWSFGITVIEMLFGEPPYFDYSTLIAIQKIIELPPPQLPAFANASIELESFVSQMLVKEISFRSTALQLLKHPFLRIAKPPSAILPVLFEIQQKIR